MLIFFFSSNLIGGETQDTQIQQQVQLYLLQPRMFLGCLLYRHPSNRSNRKEYKFGESYTGIKVRKAYLLTSGFISKKKLSKKCSVNCAVNLA